jgi:hypothetical protein
MWQIRVTAGNVKVFGNGSGKGVFLLKNLHDRWSSTMKHENFGLYEILHGFAGGDKGMRRAHNAHGSEG